MSEKINKGKVVEIRYKLKDENGKILEENQIEYLHGYKNIMPFIESNLEQQGMGFKKEIKPEPADAFGNYEDSLVMTVPRSSFENDMEIKVGMHVETETDGEYNQAIVQKIEGDQITLDGNHPLAGKNIIFDLEVLGIRAAKPEELAHGHAHGAHGHHH